MEDFWKRRGCHEGDSAGLFQHHSRLLHQFVFRRYFIYVLYIYIVELELLINGQSKIDVLDWKANTKVHSGFSRSSETVRNFWTFIETSDEKTRAMVLQFVTGSSRVPLDGFASIKFQIVRLGANIDYGVGDELSDEEDGESQSSRESQSSLQSQSSRESQPSRQSQSSRESDEAIDDGLTSNGEESESNMSANATTASQDDVDGLLPRASTCFSMLKLPNYSSLEVLTERMRIAITHSQGFDE